MLTIFSQQDLGKGVSVFVVSTYPLALCAAAAMSLLVPIKAEATKIWSPTPSPISVTTNISPTSTVVHAGSSFSLTAVATDFDYWIETPNTGSSAGPCTYAWSTDSGSVGGGMLASWTFASDAKGLCTCLLTVDDSDWVFYDTGSRDDTAVTRSFQVGVPTSAIAITKCDATAAGMHEINDTTTTTRYKYPEDDRNLIPTMVCYYQHSIERKEK